MLAIVAAAIVTPVTAVTGWIYYTGSLFGHFPIRPTTTPEA